MLSAAKHLCAHRARPFAEFTLSGANVLRVTNYYRSCLLKIIITYLVFYWQGAYDVLTAIDHIIIGVNDLERATTIFSQQLGLAVSGGGIHPAGGTANRIIVIGDTYLELITVRAPSEAEPDMLERLAKGEGDLNVVLASTHIQADSMAMARRGGSLIGPTPGALGAGGGRTRGWSRTNIERPALPQHYPFLIHHEIAGQELR